MERGISDVARMAGVTSRTLRHYHDVGLLEPSRIGANGYRFYDGPAMVRLQRILLLRQLGLGVPAIASALEAAPDDATSLTTHLDWLRRERSRLDRQIASVEETIIAITKEGRLVAERMFDGFDNSQYREEVEQRWGTKAWTDGQKWWDGLAAHGKQEFLAEHRAIAEAWAALRATGEPVDGASAQRNAARHARWIAAGWQGRTPNAEELMGLASMYVADERFAANYGGVEGAMYVRDALEQYALTTLA